MRAPHLLQSLAGLCTAKRCARWRQEGVAGLSLASMTIPQVLGYARIAGMPSVTGLYTVLLPLMVFGVFGSSKHLVVAADSATAAIFSSALSEIAPLGSPYYQDLVGMVALLSAFFLLMARFFKLGFLADFLSRTVLVGFMAGVGVQVACAMLVDMLGLSISSRNTVVQVWSLLQLLPHAVPLTAACAFGASLFLWGAERLNKAVPWALLVVVCGIVCGWALPLQAHGVSLVGPMAGGLPKLHLPHVAWNDLLALLPVATSCVFVIIAQSAATARAAANMFNETVDENRDILGLSIANLAAAVSGTFVVNGSPTQTAMALKAGARSQLAQGIFSVLTLCVLLFFTAPLRYLPHCILAAIVFNVGVGMVNVGALNRIRRESPGEFWLALITGAIVLGLGVEQGIFAAIALSLFRHVRHSYKPHTLVLKRDPKTDLFEAEPVKPGTQSEPGLVIYRFCADLFYANCATFVDEITLLTQPPVTCVVVDASAITDIDYSAALAVRTLLADLAQRRVHIIFGRVSQYLHADMKRHCISDIVGEENIFPQLHTALAAARLHNQTGVKL